jgi:hypothetical protein
VEVTTKVAGPGETLEGICIVKAVAVVCNTSALTPFTVTDGCAVTQAQTVF